MYLEEPSIHHEERLQKLFEHLDKPGEWPNFTGSIDTAIIAVAHRRAFRVVGVALEKTGNVGAYRDTGQSIPEFVEQALALLEESLVKKYWSREPLNDWPSGEPTSFEEIKVSVQFILQEFLLKIGRQRIQKRTEQLLEKLADNVDKMDHAINVTSPSDSSQQIYVSLPGLTGAMLRPHASQPARVVKVPSSKPTGSNPSSSD